MLAERKQAIGHRHQQRRRIPRADRGARGGRRAGRHEVGVSMDSKLVVEQMSGRWKVKHPDHGRAAPAGPALASTFDSVTYGGFRASENAHADRLANEAMDAAAELRRRDRPTLRPSRGGTGAARGLDRQRGVRRPDFCCCATGRPNCRCSAATPAAATRADRHRPASGRRRRAVLGRARRHRRGDHVTAAARLRHGGGGGQGARASTSRSTTT